MPSEKIDSFCRKYKGALKTVAPVFFCVLGCFVLEKMGDEVIGKIMGYVVAASMIPLGLLVLYVFMVVAERYYCFAMEAKLRACDRMLSAIEIADRMDALGIGCSSSEDECTSSQE